MKKMIKYGGAFFMAFIFVFLLAPNGRGLQAAVQRVKFESDDPFDENYLLVEFLDDDLVHFELSAIDQGASAIIPIYTTPMIDKTNYTGPSSLINYGGGILETADMRVVVDTATLCATVTDITKTPVLTLTTICPYNLTQPWKGITLTQENFSDAYGLGQVLTTTATANVNWVGRLRSPGGPMGNALVSWNGGNGSNTQFPVLYLTGQDEDSYAFFMDNPYRQQWDLRSDPWVAEMWGDWLRFYVMTGPNLQDLRKDFMELVGHPPVPPKKMFGLWVSEYGYENWAEMEDKLSTLRLNHFPVDGFVLDLQWFGGISSHDPNSSMGALTWDLTNFPNPQNKLTYLRDTQGIGITVIEESYISQNQPNHNEMATNGFLAMNAALTNPVELDAWWGYGGMIDWSDSDGGVYWHDHKREPLIADGVFAHWTDLGEPENYDPSAQYDGVEGDYKPLTNHGDVHNLYNFFWSQSIFEGYLRNQHTQRPFILSRSGAPGSQRYGVAMWSGDLSSRASSLVGQLEAQFHMSFSGIDYYGGDVGGLYRDAIEDPAYIDELYTQWLANGAAFDVPVRPHVQNVFPLNAWETAPDRVGDLASNLENLRQRYELIPYYYSLAHRAYLYAEPVIPPLVYYYQTDPVVRGMAHEKMIGRDLLVAVVAGYGETSRGVYLPAGDWINYHTNDWYHSSGEWFDDIPEYLDGKFKLPMFARAGAIIPQMFVDEKTMNILGKRTDASIRDELIVRVYADPSYSSFTLYEDDGSTMEYQNGAVRTTMISQQVVDSCVTVTIMASTGTYTGAPTLRDNYVKLIVENSDAPYGVRLNGVPLVMYADEAALDAASNGWTRSGNLLIARSGDLAVSFDKVFEFCSYAVYLPVTVK